MLEIECHVSPLKTAILKDRTFIFGLEAGDNVIREISWKLFFLNIFKRKVFDLDNRLYLNIFKKKRRINLKCIY